MRRVIRLFVVAMVMAPAPVFALCAWEGPASNRVVLTAVRRAMSLALGPEPDGFLGYWSAEIAGLSPRLLAEGETASS
jgi:hypothetical protein